MSLFAVSHYVVGDKEKGARLERFHQPVPAALIGNVRAFDGRLETWKGEEDSLLKRGLLIEGQGRDGFGQASREDFWTVLPYEAPDPLTRRIALPQEHGAAWLFASESGYSGWQASVDGRSAVIHKAEIAFQAIAVPQGAREVVLRFSAPWLGLCLGLACLALMGLILAENRAFRPTPH
jgi:hypothetical protein